MSLHSYMHSISSSLFYVKACRVCRFYNDFRLNIHSKTIRIFFFNIVSFINKYIEVGIVYYYDDNRNDEA